MNRQLPWFEQDLVRYSAELDALKKSDVSFTASETQKAKGILVLEITIPKINKLQIPLDEDLKLRIEFPDNYPFFRPEVFAPDLRLPRHQNPFAFNLCLIPRPTQFWNPEDLVVEYLQKQLPKLLIKGNITDQDKIKADEFEQAEPASEYYTSIINCVIECDVPEDRTEIPSRGVKGILELGTFHYSVKPGIEQFQFSLPVDQNKMLRLRISEWKDGKKNTVAALPEHVGIKNSIQNTGTWVRVAQPPSLDDSSCEKLFREIKSSNPNKARVMKIKHGAINEVLAITFPEEVSKGQIGWGWIFVLDITIHRDEIIGGRKIKRTKKVYQPLPATRIGHRDFSARIPKLFNLRESTIAVIGLGSLGAPSVLEFARNGVAKMHLLDFDRVEPSSTVRWPLGMKYSGLYKTEALKAFIEEHYPHTQVKIFNHKIGSARSMNHSTTPETEIVDSFLEDASLIYDASAEEGVNHLFSVEARNRKIPYVLIEARRGAWGGLIMRSNGNTTNGCWMCMRYFLTEGTIKPPPQDVNGGMQPRGCGDLSFTGASFDLQNVALAGVRLAISTLCSGVDGYDEFDWNLGVLELVDHSGKSIPPTWKTNALPVHPKCPYCATG